MVRKGQGKTKLSREEFGRRLRERFYDPAFDAVRAEIEHVIEVAWTTYDQYHKSPRTRKAGPGFANPEMELPVEWLETRARVLEAERRYADPSAPHRILLVCAASHDALDRDLAVQEEVRQAAQSLVNTVRLVRTGRYERPDRQLEAPRPK